jgi:hypothetical protein
MVDPKMTHETWYVVPEPLVGPTHTHTVGHTETEIDIYEYIYARNHIALTFLVTMAPATPGWDCSMFHCAPLERCRSVELSPSRVGCIN